MTHPIIRGWCPGAHRPMMSGDGLVVRVRPEMSQIRSNQASGLADLADQFGNAVIEITSRANLQIRGVSEDAHPELIKGLAALDLVDKSPADEAGRNIILSPFREDGDQQDDIAKLLLQRLRLADWPQLPGKFGFAIDSGLSGRWMTGVSADIRVERGMSGLLVRADGAVAGVPVQTAKETVSVVEKMVRWFVHSGGIGCDGRGRMRRHLEDGNPLPSDLAGAAEPFPNCSTPGPGNTDNGMLYAAPFGLFTSDALRFLANISNDPLRITPFRLIFLTSSKTAESQCADLITRPVSPLLRVSACVGAPGCPQANGLTRNLARQLAETLPKNTRLHVSGCAKGCAHPGVADYTLVAQSGRYDLIRNGRASDEPQARGLRPDALTEVFD